MKNDSFTLKPAGLTIALFFAFVLALAGMHFLSAKSAEDGVRKGAQAVLASWSDNPPAIGARIRGVNAGWSYLWAFNAGSRGGATEGTVYVLRITGNSGPYTGVFFRGKKSGTSFCGLAGTGEGKIDPAKYGISGRIIDMWISRIEAIGPVEDGKK